ncbi:sugar phosphate isomerase/epimerase [Termitidicoccus mucosus]|uniref:Xylose isomerase n=1 Tax=Termitidicoccus mucosus TaxID=1184151 RepID=A0A178IKV2_9BACT|nr:xylose isomerase [Opitutaceae bacterium TSB47]
MKLSQVALQLYTLRDHCRDAAQFAATAKRVREIGYTAVQISGVGPIPESELVAITRGEGLSICATHEPGPKILDETGAVIDRLQALGCRNTAYPNLAGIDLADAGQLETLARKLDAAGARLRAAGLTLGYHNHACEFARFRDTTIFEYLLSRTDPRNLVSELDTFWVWYGGHDVVDWCRRLRGRLPFIHLKDYGITVGNHHEYREIGAGSLPFPKIIAEAEAGGCEWFIVEQDETPGDPFVSVRQSFEYIRDHLVS